MIARTVPAPDITGVARHCRAARERPRGYRPFQRHLADLRSALRSQSFSPEPESGAIGRCEEWLIDNAYLVAESLEAVRAGIPRAFYRRLPQLDHGRLRIRVVADSFLDTSADALDLQAAVDYLRAFQAITPLSTAEIWAFPHLLRLALVESLVDCADRLQREGAPDVPDDAVDQVAAWVTGLRRIETYDWRDFFEHTSLLEATLRQDPADVYRQMDFPTRDRYRKLVEHLARGTRRPEPEIAAVVLGLCTDNTPGSRQHHVGYYLIGEGQSVLARRLQTRMPLREQPRPIPPPVYLLGVALGTVATIAAAYQALIPLVPLGIRLVLVATMVVPASSVVVTVMHWLATHLRGPLPLPKLDFSRGVPVACRTVVAVPTLLTSRADIVDLIRQIEINYLGNRDPHVTFVVLADPPDADCETGAQDSALLDAAAEGVTRLNGRHGNGSHTPFALFFRNRLWNPAEGRWMGWERKRGKLSQFNRWLLGTPDPELQLRAGQAHGLVGARYVITLDADTFLPPGAAERLIATLAHPLNQAAFDPAGRVHRGYTVLQPRVDVHPGSVADSRFAAIYHGEHGLDLYTRAVSDVYQDLFAEGIYAGKGIYDVAAFERSLDGRVPVNALLSHDLFEGVHGRAGLVSDVAVFEDYPATILSYARRLHRWIRGDWQLTPWLLPRVPTAFGWERNRLSLLSRWKILDNLRRSLFAPSLLALFFVGITTTPVEWVGAWVVVLAVVQGLPISLAAATAARRIALAPRSAALAGAAFPIKAQVARWAFGIVFLPYEAWLSLDASLRATYRVAVSRTNLLEWVPAAHTARAVGGLGRGEYWLTMFAGPAAAIGTALWVWANPAAVLLIGPLALVWFASPHLAWLLSRPRTLASQVPPPADVRALRHLARRTWHYFDRFVAPSDHWLAPDNYQEAPGPIAARRTSPTNIGLQLLAPVAAYDLGYIGPVNLSATLRNVGETLQRLERYRGHFLNWYDTATCEPLEPRYVSTVDSGNLAASLITLERGLVEIADSPFEPERLLSGLEDSVGVLQAVLADLAADLDTGPYAELHGHLHTLEARLSLALRTRATPAWRVITSELPAWLREFDARLGALNTDDPGGIEAESLSGFYEWAGRTRAAVLSAVRDVEQLIPWAASIEVLPDSRGVAQQTLDGWHEIRSALTADPSLRTLPAQCARVEAILARLAPTVSAEGPWAEWLATMLAQVDQSRQTSQRVVSDLDAVAELCRVTLAAMDFRFLYSDNRKLFHIGYDVSGGKLDSSMYDLLASEARLASFIAIARGDVPAEHWLYLRRPFGRRRGGPVLLSWGGTMFEYLLPTLFAETPPESLLGRACLAAVRRQIEYGRSLGVPWGVSESSYHQIDQHGTYQYRAFGVPGLGRRPALGDRLVVSPYASLLAVDVDRAATIANLRTMTNAGLLGRYGLYEAIDYGPSRSVRPKTPGAIVHSYMTHHQGMILVALDNALHGAPMVRRFHTDERITGSDFLLYEQSPRHVVAERARETPLTTFPTMVRPPRIAPWGPAPDPVPQIHVLANHQLSSLLTANGAGGVRWKGMTITRWRPEPHVGAWGHWVYVQDLDRPDRRWSAGMEPTRRTSEQYEVQFAPHRVNYRRSDDGIRTEMTVVVPPHDDLELRRLVLRNETDRVRRIAVVTCAEVSLAPPGEDRRHPAFHNLFVEGRYDPTVPALIFRRRQASADEPSASVVFTVSGDTTPPLQPTFAMDREALLGRGRTWANPAATDRFPEWSPPTLDSAAGIRCELTLQPGARAELRFMTAVAASPDLALDACRKYETAHRFARADQRASHRTELLVREIGADAESLRRFQRLLSAVVFPYHNLRAEARVAGSGSCQDLLWSLGISGDLPVLLIEVADQADLTNVKTILDAFRWWRTMHVQVDVVVLDHGSSGYNQPLQDRLRSMIDTTRERAFVAHHTPPGHVFLLAAGTLGSNQQDALRRAARLVVAPGLPSVETLLAGLGPWPDPLPAFVPIPGDHVDPVSTPSLPRPTGLEFDNGIGGFEEDGTYVIHLEPGDHTPTPWANVLANEAFGCLVTERGLGSTWAVNSAENRLTPWSNDPIADRPSEVLYLRDEETGETWSPTPGPRPAPTAHQIRHRPGVTEYRSASHELDQTMRVHCAVEDPVKLVAFSARNLGARPRRLTVTYYAEWVLGSSREITGPWLVSEYDGSVEALLVRNPFSNAFGERVAFLASSAPVHGFTADRSEFLGFDHDIGAPAGLRRIGLAGTTGPGLDTCGALQVHLDLKPHETQTVHFVLGQGADRDAARRLATRYGGPETATEALADATAWWNERLTRVTVETPDRATDLMLNQWLPYQVLACRVLARTAVYQASGAYGFRDQLQDIMALHTIAPDIARQHILRAAAKQFPEGDVLHWWHPGSGFGIRTRCSDDLLWLPYVASQYARASGDEAVWDEEIPFVTAPPLDDLETERTGRFAVSSERATLYDHCARAVDRALRTGRRGLPLMGTGDWNDGMNRVGAGGSGESVWLAWFLIATLRAFEPTCRSRGDPARADEYRRWSENLTTAANAAGWDGRWYRRAFFDDGTVVGSAESAQCRIDSIAQSWAALSEGGPRARVDLALNAAYEHLVDHDHETVLLLTPPFDRADPSPGYITAYPPGVRENGGQYTHAAAWLVWAFADRGDGDLAYRLFSYLNPIRHTSTPIGRQTYRGEPYVLPGDVGGVEPFAGRAGWTWYTGAAAWMYRCGVERLLGIRRDAGALTVDPCIPSHWETYRVALRIAGATYQITVHNPDGVRHGVVRLMADGVTLPGRAVPLSARAGIHQVTVTLGVEEPARLTAGPPGNDRPLT